MPALLYTLRPALRRGVPVLALALLAGCGGDSAKMDATPDDVDMDTPIAITDKEAAAFKAPADSVITDAQVTAYLKTSLLQFDLIRKQSVGLHEKAAEMDKREKKGGTLNQLRNLASAGSMLMQMGDMVGGSYIRSARTLGYNPAEMEWVRERMTEIGGYMMMQPMRNQAKLGAKQIREQAEQLRGQLASGQASGFTSADIDNMLRSADEVEQNAEEEAARSVLANLAVLRKSRPAVTDAMWGTVGIAGGAMGLAAISGLGDPNDAEAQKKLDEFRRLYEDALANRVSEGMEAAPAKSEP